jgi:hypothetical protein
MLLVFAGTLFAQSKTDPAVQQSIEMLNYISTLSEKIKTNKSNRV